MSVPALTRLTERGVRRMLVVAVVVDLAYWTLWFSHRSWVASDSRAAYVEFEDAFVVADAWLALACVLAYVALRRGRSIALVWLLAAGGAGLYLLGLDVLYDLQHGIYAKGTGGLIELAVNLLTAGFSSTALVWAWTARDRLLPSTPRVTAP